MLAGEWLPYGTDRVEFTPAPRWRVQRVVPRAPARRDSASEILDAALAAPIGMPPLRDLARGRRSAAILIPGKARCVGTREYVPRLLDELNAAALRDVQELYRLRESESRAASDLAVVARAATFGVVDTVFVDIDESVPGSVDEQAGAVELDEADDAVNYGVVDEIARRVWRAGGTVLAVRREDVPGGGPVAAILRYSLGS